MSETYTLSYNRLKLPGRTFSLIKLQRTCAQDPFNRQTANFILKPPKVIESRTYVKEANLERY